MAGPRKPPPRASQQQRNAIVEEEPAMRTRYGRGVKSTPTKTEATAISKASPTQANGSIDGKRRKRYFSPTLSPPETRGPYAEYTAPNLIIRGLPTQFLQELADKETRNQRKQRLYAGQFTQSDLENDTSSDESDVPTPPPTSARGRGRGGGRGGRPRGRGRGRGRGTAPAVSRHSTSISPLRTRKPRGRQPSHHSEEEDDGEEKSANQSAEMEGAKPSPLPNEDILMMDAPDIEEEDKNCETNRDAPPQSFTPPGSPPTGLPSGIQEDVRQPALTVPTIKVARNSSSQTPQNGTSTEETTPVMELIDPEDDVLSNSDFPGPWVEDHVPPATEAEAEDRADFLLKRRFKPLTDVETIISSLNKFNPAQRSTENLYRLAENTQRILLEWQNEYLRLDKLAAPHLHPPKKPAHGGRIPLDPLVYEDMKEADLYGYIYDARKTPGTQDPFAQRPGAQKTGKRELRQRRGRENMESGAPSEEEQEPENEPTGPGRRQRRATRRFEPTEQNSGATTPKKNTNGWGGARKRGVSKFAPAASETPEPDGRPAKRAKVAPKPLPHPRIQEMREESVVTTSGDEGSLQTEAQERPPPVVEEHRKRGRPAGSKNTGRRSDYGIKKGPRKKNVETPAAPAAIAPAPVAGSPAPPTVLQSMREGQSQFPLETRPSPPPQQHPVPHERPHPPAQAMAQPVATVFQATPQPLARPDSHMNAASPMSNPPPDAYMHTAPLHQYVQPYAEEATPSPVSVAKGVKTRVKSEKRSQSMTIWWAERKARQKEMEAANAAAGGEAASPKPDGSGTTSKGSTPKPPSRRGKAPRAEHPLQPYPDPNFMQHDQMGYLTPHPPPPHGLPQYPNPHLPPMDHQHHPQRIQPGPSVPPHAPPPHLVQLHTIPHHQPLPQPPPGHAIVLHPSPLAALPTTTGPPPLAPAPPPLHHSAPHTQQRQMPALAPAPGPIPQLKSYPSPYGARRGKPGASKQPVALAPAPSPAGFAPMTGAPETGREREMSFKVLVPGPPPSQGPQGGGVAGEGGSRG
ncbi:uncharacterized protein EI97DRAFT_460245 [Westerdykella ornata]|uniref:Uncharacterized protein n=1 Tax=Westerdykella ornata TaxID=318751 RepID=A0A6A6JDN0_WESOR|nr:uncharacterized protein EI97DRAFT_460245 [Westerdykella ornata]KAF2274387.1 hypothetical protein EI97DRAFT_460245 [Westerdykella ornata]